ncbi:MAG: glycosyltransferase family 2 protein [Flavobacteriia bacterium]|nr:glycosyltransferase family 2 protein [Flavobacteriia bacterium]
MSKSNTDFIVVTAMNNEGPYILEWVAHHLAIGFGHFIVVTNDCEDGTDEILLALQQRGLVTHVINPRVLSEDLGKWQVAALKIAQYYPAYRKADWILHADVDEFVRLRRR